MTAVVAIAGGAAGDDKSILSSNLSRYLSQKGHRTGLLVTGARQPIWGIEPDGNWPDILDGSLSPAKTIHSDIFGIDLMVAGNCGRTLQELCARNGSCLDDDLGILDAYTYLIVDCAVQTSPPALACCLAAAATLLLLPSDTAGLTATWEWLAHLTRHDFQGPIHIVLDQANNPTQARSIYLRFRDQVRNRLRLQTRFWGLLNKEPSLDPRSVHQYPLSRTMPQSELLRNIHAIGDRLVTEQPPEHPAGPPKEFWRSFLGYLRRMPVDPAIFQKKSPTILEGRTPAKNFNRPATENAQAMEWLNTHLTNIAHDLQAIRRLLEADTQANPGPSQGESLDFDEFVGRHQKHEEQ
jgi:MinD-like ATPase involved in chromosome partitioning or flagellar assembly